jgi:hypothetical protein
MEPFGIGILVGVVLAIVVFMITVRLLGRPQLPIADANTGFPDLTLSLNRDLLQRLIDDSLRDVQLPLVSLRDPNVQLEPGGVLVLRMRGDTVLLGAQPIALRMQLLPATTGIRVQTTSADVGVLGDVAGPLTQRLDEQINAELARQLSFAEGWEVLEVGGTTEEVVINARLRE